MVIGNDENIKKEMLMKNAKVRWKLYTYEECELEIDEKGEKEKQVASGDV